MTTRKILYLVSFGLLLYLLIDSFMHFDLAATKNNAMTSMQKMEIDSTQSIDTVKQKAKEYLDTIRRVHRQYSSQSVINSWALAGLLLIQTVLLSMKLTTSSTKQNGR
jgi:hypothetical protein